MAMKMTRDCIKKYAISNIQFPRAKKKPDNNTGRSRYGTLNYSMNTSVH
jgi:hypothetical protein